RARDAGEGVQDCRPEDLLVLLELTPPGAVSFWGWVGRLRVNERGTRFPGCPSPLGTSRAIPRPRPRARRFRRAPPRRTPAPGRGIRPPGTGRHRYPPG